MTEPMTMSKRSRLTQKIEKEADRAAARLGASHVVIIAFFPDGEGVHMLEGGNPPLPYDVLHKHLQTASAVLEESGGEDVALS